MTKFTDEMLAKVKAAATAEELMALAKENDIELTLEEAEANFAALNAKTGELADEELDNVSGGGCRYKDGRLITTVANHCSNWECKKTCHSRACVSCAILRICDNCEYCSYEHALWLCNNPENRN